MNRLLAKQVLCQLSYTPKVPKRGIEPRPLDLQSSALPVELLGHLDTTRMTSSLHPLLLRDSESQQFCSNY